MNHHLVVARKKSLNLTLIFLLLVSQMQYLTYAQEVPESIPTEAIETSSETNTEEAPIISETTSGDNNIIIPENT
jgi:hypothetical protein